MDMIFDWNLGNMIYNGLITLRLGGFPFAEIGVISIMSTSRRKIRTIGLKFITPISNHGTFQSPSNNPTE